MLRLDERLRAIEDLVPACRCFADIGCDHGRLGAQMLLSGRAQRVWFTDISAPSIEKARVLSRKLGLSDRAVFRVGDGARALDQPPDAAAIAGMGAANIADILRAGAQNLGDAQLILQPNLEEDELRGFLQGAGYAILRERVVRAGGRWYVLLLAQRGAMRLSEAERVAGTASMRADAQAYEGYARFRIRVAKKALEGARQGRDGREEALARSLAIWEEAIR